MNDPILLLRKVTSEIPLLKPPTPIHEIGSYCLNERLLQVSERSGTKITERKLTLREEDITKITWEIALG